jgi:DNA-binding MarR family transcriptional regulator
MSSVRSAGPDDSRRRRRLTVTIRDSLRALNTQLSLLNYQVGAHLKLKDVDVNCLDLLSRYGPLSPTALARRAGLHPATMTGILDRLERGGWVRRDRDPADRRGVVVRVLRDRTAEIFTLYAGMNSAMDQICAGYQESELELLADFLSRTAAAGGAATQELSGG